MNNLISAFLIFDQSIAFGEYRPCIGAEGDADQSHHILGRKPWAVSELIMMSEA